MKYEPFVFPLMIVAATITVWLALRNPAGAAPAPASNSALPTAVPQPVLTTMPYYMLPTRQDPPASDVTAGPSYLPYPPGLTAAQAVGSAASGNLAGANSGSGCGCCGS